MNSDFLEKLIIKASLQDIDFLTTVSLVFNKDYFYNEVISSIFGKLQAHVKEYGKILPTSVIKEEIDGAAEVLDDIDDTDFDLASNYTYLFHQTNEFLKDRSLKKAILDSADIINSDKEKQQIRHLVEDALTKDLKPDIGTKYFETLSERLRKEFDAKENRIPTFFPQFDEYINGGFPPFTLSVFIARIHEWKCLSGDTFIKLKRDGKIYYDKIENLFSKQSRISPRSMNVFGVYRMNIAKEVKRCSGVKIFTDVGWIPINYIIKTIPFRKYIVLFESGNEVECAGEHCFINVDYQEILAKNLTSGDKIISEYGYDIIFDVLETDEVLEMYDVSLPYHNLYYANDILSHNSATLANVIARQVLHGYNIALMSLEMAEQAFSQRFDAIFSKLDINKMYRTSYRSQLIRFLKETKSTDGRGEIFIKQFPTGEASCNDFRIYLRELKMRGYRIDVIYADYINLMKPEYRVKSEMYSDVKKIAEELRSLSYEFEAPVISVSQLNREGSSLDLKALDFVYISESMGVPATADFVMFYGSDQDNMVYESELFYKIAKNRLGGRVGEIGKFYYDTRNLKLYDSVEFDMWKDDAEISGDSREISPQIETVNQQRRRR